MTKKQALDLEKRCDTIMSTAINENCFVSLALTGNVKIQWQDNFITINKHETKEIDYVCYAGCFEDLKDKISKILKCYEENFISFEKLRYSYENINEIKWR